MRLQGGLIEIRLLVAFGDSYRAYRGAISAALQTLRPLTEVETAGTDALGEALVSFDPQVVISSRPEATANLTDRVTAWVELPMEPDAPGQVRMGERHFELWNAGLEQLLEVIDEAERLLRANAEARRSHAP